MALPDGVNCVCVTMVFSWVSGDMDIEEGAGLVTKSNRLIEACYRLDLTELRIIMMAIHIGRVDDLLCAGQDRDLCAPIRIKAALFTEHFPMHEHMIYKQLREGVKSLVRKPLVTIETIRGDKCEVDIPWFSKAAYLPKEGAIEVEFNRHVLPYISRLTGEFTEYRIEKIGRLSSAHAVRLYEILVQYLSLGKRDIEIDWFKKTLLIEHEYPAVYDLKKRVIDPAVKQINDLTDLAVRYVQKKRGRVVTSFLFTVKMKSDRKLPTQLSRIDEALITQMARPGESRDETYQRIRSERSKAQKAKKSPTTPASVQLGLTEVEPAATPPSAAAKKERAKVLAAARKMAVAKRGL